MLMVVLALAAVLLVVALIVVFRKVDKLPLPRMAEKPRGAGLSADELDDFVAVGGRKGLESMRRQTTRTGTVYQPPAVATPDDLSNVIVLAQLQQPEPVADATREYAVPITPPEPCHTPASHDSHHSVDTSGHCHSSDTGGGGFDGGGHGGHH